MALRLAASRPARVHGLVLISPPAPGKGRGEDLPGAAGGAGRLVPEEAPKGLAALLAEWAPAMRATARLRENPKKDG